MTDKELLHALHQPFAAAAIRWRPGRVKDNRAMALAYIDARHVMNRLDQVFGVSGWQDAYEFLADGCVLCKLSVMIEGAWITKVDVGGPSEQPDKGDKMKAAVSDALKRSAIKFGIGRYLYQLPSQWVDYDPQTKRFKGKPSLPAWAIPNAVADAMPAEEPYEEPEAAVPVPEKNGKPAISLPQNGGELLERLSKKDEAMSIARTIQRGALLAYVRAEGLALGFSDDLILWDAEQAKLGFELAKEFVQQRERGLITHAELDEIMQEIEKREVMVEAILEYFRIKTLSSLPAAQLPVLRERLSACKLRALESVPIT